MSRIDVPFLIVGAGPIGMIEAALLSKLGRECLVVERRATAQTAPAAHVVNARTLEICRQAGLDMPTILAACKNPADAGHVRFVTRLAGEQIGHLPFERQGDECLRYTPTPLRNLSQHRFEPILADTLGKLGNVDLRYGWQWERSEQDDDGVTSVLTKLATGETQEVRSRWLIAADGASSRVRASVGIEMQGPPRIQSFLMIHFGANLREIVRDRPGVLHFIMDPEAGGAFIAHDIDREWVYMHDFDPDTESEQDYDDERCRELVVRAIGREEPIEILHKGTWHMSSQVADDMREGRIFLAGDAAHRFPPTGGMGLNSGFQDAHNLAWKICAVEDGWAPPALLDSYAEERIAIAQENSEQSLTNALKMILLPQVLGVDVEPTSARMAASLADPEKRQAVSAAIEEQAEHFDMLGLQLGFVYEKGAVLSDGTSRPVASTREYAPCAYPGARLPHAWTDADVDERSTLDWIAYDRFALITFGDHERWASAVAAVSNAPLVQLRVGIDAEVGDEWRSVCGVEANGALLVRPDQHVAWRKASLSKDAVVDLEEVIAKVLGGSK